MIFCVQNWKRYTYTYTHMRMRTRAIAIVTLQVHDKFDDELIIRKKENIRH